MVLDLPKCVSIFITFLFEFSLFTNAPTDTGSRCVLYIICSDLFNICVLFTSSATCRIDTAPLKVLLGISNFSPICNAWFPPRE